MCTRKSKKETFLGSNMDSEFEPSMHSYEIIGALVNKEEGLTDEERELLDLAFELAYPNGV